MFVTKYRTNKLYKLKSTVMHQQEVLLNQENQQLKQVFFFNVSQFIAKNATGFYRREIYVKFFI